MFEVPAHGAGENDPLEITAPGDQVFYLIAMGDACHILFDDGAIVENACYVMTCRSDELDPARVSSVIGTRADKCGQEGVMNVDDGRRIAGNKAFCEDLHVAGQDNQLHVEGFEECALPVFGFEACGQGNGDVLKRYAVKGGELLRLPMVGHDNCYLAGEFTGTPSIQQVGDAVQILRTKECYARALLDKMELPSHIEFCCEDSEGISKDLKITATGGECPLNAHEEEAKFVVLVLVRVEDVGALRVEEARDAGYEALLVGAVDEKNSSVVGNFSHRFQLT